MPTAARLLVPVLFILAASHAPAPAAEMTYSLNVLGVPVAEATLAVDLTKTQYRISLRYHTTGAASLLSGDHLEDLSSGTFDHDGPVPVDATANIRARGQDRTVHLLYRGATPVIAAISPPNETEREDVPPKAREHTIDPLSATAAILHQAAETGRCDVTRRTYDGRRLEQFLARTTGEEAVSASIHSHFSGPALRCDYTSEVMAGFRTDNQRAEDSRIRGGTLWLAPLLPNYPRLPIRGEVDIRLLGRATMYLTAVRP